MHFHQSLLAAAARYWGVALAVCLLGGCGAPPATTTAETDSTATTDTTPATSNDVASTSSTYQPAGDAAPGALGTTGSSFANEKRLPLSASAGAPSAGGHDNWISDFAAAKSQAQTEDKDILMDFTGSDWCSWCIRLKDEVFRHTEFTDYAQQNFVLLELDFPRDKSRVSAETQAQNAELQSRFSIQGYPTIILTDAQGRPYAQTGYQQGGAENYVKHLEELKTSRQTRDEAFDAAAQLDGVERAKKLAEGLEAIPAAYVLPSYEEQVAEIIRLDSENEAGLREQFQSRLLASRFQQRYGEIREFADSTRDVDASLKKLDELANDEDFAEYKDGRVMMKLMRLQLLHNGKRMEELVTVADGVLADSDVPAETRFQVYLAKLGGLQQLDRIPEAVDVIDAFLQEFSGDSGLAAQLYLRKADFLNKLDRKQEAKDALQEARKLADEQLLPVIEQYEKSLQETKPDSTPSTPPAGQPPQN